MNKIDVAIQKMYLRMSMIVNLIFGLMAMIFYNFKGASVNIEFTLIMILIFLATFSTNLKTSDNIKKYKMNHLFNSLPKGKKILIKNKYIFIFLTTFAYIGFFIPKIIGNSGMGLENIFRLIGLLLIVNGLALLVDNILGEVSLIFILILNLKYVIFRNIFKNIFYIDGNKILVIGLSVYLVSYFIKVSLNKIRGEINE